MRTKLKPFILAITATFPMAVFANAGFDDTIGQSQTDKTLAVKNVSYETEYSFMYKDFEVVAPDDGDYYMEFWLIPAEYPDGAYTTFSVFVNDTKVGEITPKTGNWQACRVNGNEKVSLNKGINKISIGTSMACPHVAGLAALILARNPNLSASEVRSIIGKNTKKIGNLPYSITKSYGTWNEYYGYGLIDAYQAIVHTPLF